MAKQRSEAQGRGALEHLADELGHDADSFTPDVETAPRDLPGRRRGEALERDERPTSGPAAVLWDIGTSRQEGFTHVLWVSAVAESLLGSERFNRLGEHLDAIDGVEAHLWESADHLHLRAPERGHEELLHDARAIVAGLLA